MKLDSSRVPAHIAFIIDGNGRWAQRRGLPRHFGYKVGYDNLKKRAIDAFDLGVKVVSVYGFSTENWKRPQEELEKLFDIFKRAFTEEIDLLNEKGIRIEVMGDYTKFPEKIVENCRELIETTKHNNKCILNLGLNYGSRAEMLRGINKLLSEGKTEITEADIDGCLYTANYPPLDFLIRTSGEQRLSNFMLWQVAYTEFYFPKVLWPDFSKRDLVKSLKVYQKRNRRFGGLNTKPTKEGE